MGEKGRYGLKIKSYHAGSIYEVERGVRDFYDCKDAFLANSLLLDFLKENGLSVYKESSTRDVICIDFDYGSSSYEENVKRMKKKRDAAAAENNEALVARYDSILEKTELVKDKFDKKSRERLREMFYEDGVRIKYPVYNKKSVVGYEWITYKMLFRTPGKAKRGLCMFIREELFEKTSEFMRMGIELPDTNAKIVEIGAYSSLIGSGVEGRIVINPDDILILNDFSASFRTNVISVEINENHECITVPMDDYELATDMFDGQALIDESIFPAWASGYILLRHHFTKCAAFCTRIQRFFKDYCKKNGLSYENFQVFDMFGNAHLARDIKMITTDNAIKWLKLGVTYDHWRSWVNKNGNIWGIVKTAHPSKLGDVQRMSYQMVNALDLENIDYYMEKSVSYVERLCSDDQAFLSYLRRTANFSNDHEVLIALAEWNPAIMQSDYFRRRKERIIRTYKKHLNSGRIIQNADNLVIVGSPYAMLLHAVGEDPTSDPTFEREDDAIQCWTARFKNDEYLAEFRSPFNSQNNLGYLHNVYHEYFDKYFDLGRLIIAVNLNGTAFCDRNNGSDQDSDSIYVTNETFTVSRASYCYKNYPTIVNNIPKESKTYNNDPKDFAMVDNVLAKAQRNIGESSNLSQICLSYTYTFDDEKFQNYSCILAVLAQASIDSTKRRFDIDITDEIKRIKADIDIDQNGYPEFWRNIRPGFDQKKINYDIKCPMNSVSRTKYREVHPSSPTLPLSDFFNGTINYTVTKESKKVREMINKYAFKLAEDKYDGDIYGDADRDDYFLALDNHEEFIEDLRQVALGKKYRALVLWLLKQTFCNRKVEENYKGIIEKTRPLLMKVLYDVNKENFLECFKGPENPSLTNNT